MGDIVKFYGNEKAGLEEIYPFVLKKRRRVLIREIIGASKCEKIKCYHILTYTVEAYIAKDEFLKLQYVLDWIKKFKDCNPKDYSLLIKGSERRETNWC